MLDTPVLWWLASRLPVLLPGRLLHHTALRALRAGDHAAAERLFESAAARYRRDLEVEPLARLRVHQLIARLHATAGSLRAPELRQGIEERLLRLDDIESLAPPFVLVPASRLLASLGPGVASTDAADTWRAAA